MFAPCSRATWRLVWSCTGAQGGLPGSAGVPRTRTCQHLLSPPATPSHASQPQSPAPARRLVPHGQARLGHAHHQPGYSHGNAYVHRETRTHAGLIVAPPTDALLSFSLSLSLPVTGCPAGRWTTMVARVQVCTVATLPILQDSQEGVGLHEGASGIRVDGPLARTQDHEANVGAAKQVHL